MLDLYAKILGFAAAGCIIPIVPASAAPEKVLYSFQGGNDGALPGAGLVDVNGIFYGTTVVGGASGDGTIFSITKQGAESVIYAFKGGTDGSTPFAGLTNVAGMLYGTASYGGSGCGCGVVLQTTTTGAESVLYSFKGGTDGSNPQAGLINVGKALYGTTFGGGAYGYGTVFSVTTSGEEKVIYSFKGASDGAYPDGALVNVGGTFYGTTYQGGNAGCEENAGCGTVFSVTRSGKKNKVYVFQGGNDGNAPFAGLASAGDTLYGTTAYGGTGGCAHSINVGCGTVFSVTLAGAEKVLHSFQPTNDAVWPEAGLVYVDGTLYGTGSSGGSFNCGASYYGCGAAFSVTTAGVEKVIHYFGVTSTDGFTPMSGLINVGGKLYGTTRVGGISGGGTVYLLRP